MEQKRNIRAAVFDLDGTLIDSMEIWREVDEDFFARRGMPVPENYQERIAHLGFRECADFTVRNYLPAESREAVIEEWRELSLSKYSAADGAKYFKAGAIGLLRRLKGAGLRLGVATASSPDFYMPILCAGGSAVISVVSNLVPDQVKLLVRCVQNGDLSAANNVNDTLLPLINACFAEVNPIPVKAAMNLLGFDAGIPRAPLTPIEPEHLRLLKDALNENLIEVNA